MSKHGVVLAFLLGSIPILIILLFLSPVSASADSNFVFTDDPGRGYLTAENDVVKLVWHYKILPSEYNNRGGGNIYELYDKRSDPTASRNLVSVYNAGTGGTNAASTGIGGLGATYVYGAYGHPASADNGENTRPVATNHYIDGNGNAVFEASFIVLNVVPPKPDDYQVDKKWTVMPDGKIKLDINMRFLRSYDISEPAYNFSFNRDYGWNNASSVGHWWDNAPCGNVGVGNPNNALASYDQIGQMTDGDIQLMHSESFDLYGQQNGSQVRVKMDNNGQGFENGGLFKLGERLWGTTADPTVEFSISAQRAYGYALHFYGWWGTGSPPLERYRHVEAGTTFSDSLWIEMEPSSSRVLPMIVGGVAVNSVSTNSAALAWTTNFTADARASYWTSSGADRRTVSETQWDTNHHAVLTGLTPGTTYQYEVRSRDGTGEAVQSGTFSTAGMLNLAIARTATKWDSYRDYLDRRLHVDFTVSNSGPSSALSGEVLLVSASSGVSGSMTDPVIGDIPAGGSRVFPVYYHVPDGVASFFTKIYYSTLDAGGIQHYFPEAPPLH